MEMAYHLSLLLKKSWKNSNINNTSFQNNYEVFQLTRTVILFNILGRQVSVIFNHTNLCLFRLLSAFVQFCWNWSLCFSWLHNKKIDIAKKTLFKLYPIVYMDYFCKLFYSINPLYSLEPTYFTALIKCENKRTSSNGT